MQKEILTKQLVKVDRLCIASANRLDDNNSSASLWSAIYTLSVAMYYILTQLLKGLEKHE